MSLSNICTSHVTSYDTYLRLSLTMEDSRRTAAALLLLRRRRRRRNRRFWIHPILERRQQLGEYHRLVQELKLDEDRFFQYFRMSKEVFQILLCKVGPVIAKRSTNYRDSIAPEQRLAICLRYVKFCAQTGKNYILHPLSLPKNSPRFPSYSVL